MTSSMKLQLRPSPGALLRVLGLAERRGYGLVSLEADCGAGLLTLFLTVRSTRPLSLFLGQLGKLHDVQQVEVLT
jgi:acetolactate synthase II small subunit